MTFCFFSGFEQFSKSTGWQIMTGQCPSETADTSASAILK